MKLGFLVLKKSFLKHYAPLIEESLARGIPVTLLVDQTGDECGFGGYEFPHVDELPRFRNGAPDVRPYATREELGRIVGSRRLDAVFAVLRRRAVDHLRAELPDLFLAQLQTVPDPIIISHVDTFDAVYGFTPSWVQWSADYMVHYGRLHDTERDVYAKRLEAIYVPVGFAEMEQLRYIDPASVRAGLGVPGSARTVLYLPFPFKSTRHHGGFWPRHIYGASRPWQYASALAARRTEFLPYARHGWNDRALVRALRQFCDRTGALLLVKGREKNPVPRYLAAVADRVFYDDAYYPATILELAAITDLCVHFYSTGLSEVVFAGAPNLCVSPTPAEWPIYGRRRIVKEFSTTPPAFYHYPGVTYSWTVPETITRLPSARFEDFPLEAAARRKYLERFLGYESLDVSARILRDLDGRLGRRACWTR